MKNLKDKIKERAEKALVALISSPLKQFKSNTARGKHVDLESWAQLPPDNQIASFGNISCDEGFLTLSETLRNENKIVLSVREMWNIYNWVNRTKHIEGAIAELGVFNGGSAKLMCEIENRKHIFLFDTFEGLPETTDIDNLNKGDVCGDTFEHVQQYLVSYPNIIFQKGFFPETTATVEEKQRFSFVHLDADTYQSTLAALTFFYPRLSKGGAIISHDYRCKHTLGVKKAFDEFFQGKPEPLIELWDTQVLIVKQ